MKLTSPIDFDEVIKLIAAKKITPTELSSLDIRNAPAEFGMRGMFSAKTMNAQQLALYQKQIEEMAAGQMNDATARANMKNLIDELEIAPPSEEEAGTITDLGSNARIGLVLRTNLAMARGKGQYDEGMAPGALEAFPALELIRVEDRMRPREWIEIWDAAADELGDETSATNAEETGRMVAKKGDPIWLAISDFGQPWPPFKFNSGMGVEDVDWQDAVDLGVVDPDDEMETPEDPGFNANVIASVAEMAAPLVEQLAVDLEGVAEKVGEAFRILPAPKAKPLANRAAWILDILDEQEPLRSSTHVIDGVLELLEAA